MVLDLSETPRSLTWRNGVFRRVEGQHQRRVLRHTVLGPKDTPRTWKRNFFSGLVIKDLRRTYPERKNLEFWVIVIWGLFGVLGVFYDKIRVLGIGINIKIVLDIVTTLYVC